jgi:hypothetical protein
MFVPQGVPSPTLPVGAHVCVPVAHDVVPVAHGLPPGAHATPAEHATQLPLLQTMFVPHPVPSDAWLPVSPQAIPPSAHVMEPMSQGAPDGVQGEPFVHA